MKKKTGHYFLTGAYRDGEEDKDDPEGFMSPIVIDRYCKYMTKHRKQSDGKLRNSDNWQQGVDKSFYMKSLWRHFLDLWLEHRNYKSRDGIEEALTGILFNAQGYLFEVLKEKQRKKSI